MIRCVYIGDRRSYEGFLRDLNLDPAQAICVMSEQDIRGRHIPWDCEIFGPGVGPRATLRLTALVKHLRERNRPPSGQGEEDSRP